MTRAARGPTEATPEVRGHADFGRADDTLTVMTLNLAHGRSTGFHQILTSKKKLRSNLEAVAEVMNREGPDVIAVQEADGPSLWSGRFDHVEYIADTAGYPVHMRGEHVLGARLRYGTALISRFALHDPLSVTFPPPPPSPRASSSPASTTPACPTASTSSPSTSTSPASAPAAPRSTSSSRSCAPASAPPSSWATSTPTGAKAATSTASPRPSSCRPSSPMPSSSPSPPPAPASTGSWCPPGRD